MRKAIGIGAFIGALALIAVTAQAHDSKEGFKRLTVDQVEHIIHARSATIYDNNGRDRYEKGHVPTAHWLSIADIKPSDLPADKDRALIFYCGNTKCMACHQGAEKALEYGHRNVSIMPAGIAGWEAAGKPVEK